MNIKEVRRKLESEIHIAQLKLLELQKVCKHEKKITQGTYDGTEYYCPDCNRSWDSYQELLDCQREQNNIVEEK